MNKKLVLLDMDGTIYLGDHLFDGVLECFDYFNKNDIKFVFITNNSSHDLEFYENKIKRMGISCSKENFYSSIEVTLEYLKKKNAKKIYVLGNTCLKNKLKDSFEIVSTYSKDEKLDAVVCGFNTELVYEDLKNACLYLETQEVEFLATNGDYRCPIEDGLYIPDCGGMIEWMRLCTGKTARVLGKPDPEIINQLIKKYNELYGENRKFDEVFRGTEILDKRFNADFIADANGAPLSVENEKYAEFCMAYTKYVLDFQMAQFYGTFKDIYEALCEDLTASGYRSLYFNNPANPKVKVLSGEFFNEIGRDVDKLSNFLLEKSETLKREIVKMQKTKMLESDSAMQEQYNAAVAALNETENNILVLEHIYNWLDAIYERFKSANSVTIDFKSRFVDKSVYLLTGNGFGGKNKLEINDVYIHQNEIDYVTTILKVIAEAKPLIDKIKAHFGILESAKERQ